MPSSRKAEKKTERKIGLKKPGRAASISDVARESGVSIFTVSAVVNNKSPRRQDLRQRVENAIRKLNYRPNLIARSLIKQKTQTIGMIVTDIANPFFPMVVRGAEDAAQKQGYNLLLCNSDDSLEKEENAVELLLVQASGWNPAYESRGRLSSIVATDDQRGQHSLCSGDADLSAADQRCGDQR